MARYVYHLECPSGIAGDMFLGACLDLGMPLEVVADAVRALGLQGVELEHRHAQRGGLTGSRFRVLVDGRPVEGPDPEESGGRAQTDPQEHSHDHGHSHGHAHEDDPVHAHEHPHDEPAHPDHGEGPTSEGPATEASNGRPVPTTYRGIAQMVASSDLDEATRERALSMLRRVGEAEAQVHGVGLDEVHFHELAAIDSIVDIVGAAAAMEHLDAERVTCGTVVLGSGTVHTEHGVMPVPAPATARLLHGVPTTGGGRGELTTPTGALILAEWVDDFVPQPAQRTDGFGHGLGKKDLADRPNALRLSRGRDESLLAGSDSGLAEVSVIECHVDDTAGETLGYLQESLLEEGALDVFLVPVQMKKGRPGVLVTVLCRHGQRRSLAETLLRETGSLGCRFSVAERLELDRHWESVSTRFGEVRVKVGTRGSEVFSQKPEFEDCRSLAKEHGVPLEEVYRAALNAAANMATVPGGEV